MVERKPSTLQQPSMRKSSRVSGEILPPTSRKSSQIEDPKKPSSRRTGKVEEIIQPQSRTSGISVVEPKVLVSLGEQLMRTDLHSDPFENRELELEAEKRRKEVLKRNAESLLFRESLRSDIIEQTKNRMKHTLGTSATEENVNYCTLPCLQLLEQQSKLVEECRNEIDGLQKILESKQLDIAKLSSENDKFLSLSRGKRDWREYELLLAKERIVNRRLISMMADQQNEKILEEGRKNTYQEWIDQKAQIGSGNHSGTVFPRRRLSPKY